MNRLGSFDCRSGLSKPRSWAYVSKWGTSIADKLGLVAVVESTNQGRALYASEGFEYIDTFETKLPEKWEGKKRKQKFHWMVRPCAVSKAI
jgi:hypothetical protein